MLKLTPTQNICTIPAELTGAVEVSIQSSNSMDRLYTVAQGSVTCCISMTSHDFLIQYDQYWRYEEAGASSHGIKGNALQVN